MSEVARMLPANAEPAEAAMEQATALRLDTTADSLWNAATCPAPLLPWLAWAFSVDIWDERWSEARQRAVIAASVEVHRRKGTRGAVVAALAAAGLGDARLIERDSPKRYDGAFARDGTSDRSSPAHWAEYRVVMGRPLSIRQSVTARRIIEASAPARCHLAAIDFREAALLYDGAAPRDGTYTRGIV